MTIGVRLSLHVAEVVFRPLEAGVGGTLRLLGPNGLWSVVLGSGVTSDHAHWLRRTRYSPPLARIRIVEWM